MSDADSDYDRGWNAGRLDAMNGEAERSDAGQPYASESQAYWNGYEEGYYDATQK